MLLYIVLVIYAAVLGWSITYPTSPGSNTRAWNAGWWGGIAVGHIVIILLSVLSRVTS